MDDMNAFERQVVGQIRRFAGPSRPVDDAAIFTAITATRSPKWRFRSMFSATKFVVAGAIVALFGGFLLAGVLTQPSEDRVPAAGAATPASISSVDPTRALDRYLDMRARLTTKNRSRGPGGHQRRRGPRADRLSATTDSAGVSPSPPTGRSGCWARSASSSSDDLGRVREPLQGTPATTSPSPRTARRGPSRGTGSTVSLTATGSGSVAD